MAPGSEVEFSGVFRQQSKGQEVGCERERVGRGHWRRHSRLSGLGACCSELQSVLISESATVTFSSQYKFCVLYL